MNLKRIENGQVCHHLSNREGMSGVSLVELMIAILIGTILLIGLMQIFSASREAYRLSEGLSRVQENSRFAMDYMQRDIRMAGHWGCVNDQAMNQSTGFFDFHINGTAHPALNFIQSIEAYEAANSAPTDTVNVDGSATASWLPALPGYLANLAPAPAAGSDVIVVRYLTAQSVPVTELDGNLITTDVAKWSVLTQEGVATPGLFGMSDCTYLDIFQGTTVGAGAVTVDTTGLNTVSFDPASRYGWGEASNTMLYRADVVAYYVSSSADVNEGSPTLYRVRFNAAPGAGAVTPVVEPLVEGIENIQIVYGLDDSTDLTSLSGRITSYVTGQGIADQNTAMRIGAVKVAVLARSQERASVTGQVLEGLGTKFTLPPDGRYRDVYETTIALRNRLYGN